MFSFPLLTTIVFLPLAGALGILTCWRNDLWCRRITLSVMMADMLLVMSLFALNTHQGTAGFPGGWLRIEDFAWIPAFGARFTLALDGISLMLILLTAALGILAVLVSWKAVTQHVTAFHFFLLIMQTGVLGVFLSTDILLFYLFWEAQTIPMFFLIGVWGHDRRIYATIKFALFTIAGSLLMLAALLSLYILHGRQSGHYTFSLLQLTSTTFSSPVELLLFAAFTIAFAIKAPLIPVHTWLPDAHTEAPTAGSVILAGILLKTGAYALLRFAFPLFPDAACFFTPWLICLGLAGVFYAGWIALAQKDVKRLVAYSSISHMGLIVVGLAVWNLTSLSGSLLQMINHGITTSALFIMIGMLDERLHTRQLSDMGGLWKTIPVWSAFFLFFTLASLGLPGLNNFVGEILILAGTFSARPWAAVIGFLGLLWTVAYSLRMIHESLWGEPRTPRPQNIPDLTLRELIILAPLCMMVFWLGLHPGPALDILQNGVSSLLTHNARLAALTSSILP